jgi:hypothetical protein
VIEPTGPAWLPVAVFSASTGDVVYRVSSQKAADLRRSYCRDHKTNRIDATTVARIAILEGEALRPVELATGLAGELDRQVRVTRPAPGRSYSSRSTRTRPGSSSAAVATR